MCALSIFRTTYTNEMRRSTGLAHFANFQVSLKQTLK